MAFCRTSSTVQTHGSSPRQNAVLWSGSAVHWGVGSLDLPAVLLLRSPGCTPLAPVQSAAAFQRQVPFGTPPACGVARGYSCPGARLHFYSYRISEGSCWLIPMACSGSSGWQPSPQVQSAGLSHRSQWSLSVSHLWLMLLLSPLLSDIILVPLHIFSLFTHQQKKDVLCVLSPSNWMFEVSFFNGLKMKLNQLSVSSRHSSKWLVD